MSFHYVGQADLVLLGSSDLPASASQNITRSQSPIMLRTAAKWSFTLSSKLECGGEISVHCNFHLPDSIDTGFHHVGQGGLELLTSSDPSALASLSTGITGMSHQTWPLQDLKKILALNKADDPIAITFMDCLELRKERTVRIGSLKSEQWSLTQLPKMECSGMFIAHCRLLRPSDPPTSASQITRTIGLGGEGWGELLQLQFLLGNETYSQGQIGDLEPVCMCHY
ncbi:hypothetical protein AAY473_021010 [Plecturocebus cupreus]